MAKTKRFFLSDVHLGVGGACDWYQRDKHERFLVGMLERVAAESEAHQNVKDLVLLGDIFDTWMAPIEEVPPSTSQILEQHPRVVDLLRRCLQTVENVFYINGNHDMLTAEADLQPVSAGQKRIKHIPRYHGGLLYAEHGSRFAMFNAPDYLHDAVNGLPLGYYITRILARNHEYTRPSALLSYVDDLLEAASTTQSLAESVIEAVVEQAKCSLDAGISMPNGRKVKILDVQRRYAPLFQRWVEKFGYAYTINAIRGEMNSLGWFADRLCKKEGYKVVVFGHTHEAMRDLDGFAKPDRAYVNCGNFCSDAPTFVEVDKLPGRFRVAIYGGVATQGAVDFVPKQEFELSV